MRILVVEDEAQLAELLRRGLTEEGHAVDLAATGEEALDWVEAAPHDAIVLDVMLPGISEFDVCRQVRRQRRSTPILLLKVRDDVADRVAGLDARANDYLVKPFAFAELLARLRALARRPWFSFWAWGHVKPRTTGRRVAPLRPDARLNGLSARQGD